ncbi:hypothetical protein J7U29_01950 [Lactobacillus delbrueckii subsp. lactis]|uniref:hypothetical protein n=1 Tax=Lactobacillus delbrueckii TaxID=1584 RepID=UPI001E2F5570|nr:hypothetical protein [Lactobacillus delbrueckii]MCD5528357.1 hypothetical protein [Lactobacillus delbrueckii subsp. lactis]
MTPNLTAFTGVDSQNLLDVMVSVQFILAIGGQELKDNYAKVKDDLQMQVVFLINGLPG